MPRTALNIIALLILAIGVYYNWFWPWGALFLYWTVLAYMSGEVNLISEINSRDTPVLYWIVLISWFVLSLYYIIYDLVYFFG